MKNEIQEILEKNGIQIYQEDIDVSEENMKKKGYRKMSMEDVLRFTTIFQDAPEVAKDIFYNKAVQRSFNDAVKDTYRLILDPQFHLGRSHRTPSAFSGNAFDAGNHLKTVSEWMKNDSELNLSMLPEISTRFFSIASFITGQYYISQINHNIEYIKSEIEEVQQFLENDKDSKIQAVVDNLADITDHLSHIRLDPLRISTTIKAIGDIKTIAKTYISFNNKRINQEINKASSDDNLTTIENKIKTIAKATIQYELLVEVYCHAVLMEILLSNITNKEELYLYRTKMKKVIDRYLVVLDTVQEWIKTYLENNHSLNEKSKIQKAVNVLLAGSELTISLLGKHHHNHASFKRTVASVNNLFNENRVKDRKEQINLSNGLMAPLVERQSTVEGAIEKLDNYIEVTSKELIFIKTGEVIYTNIPE